MRAATTRIVLVGLMAVAGCAAATRDRAWMDRVVLERTRHGLGPRTLDARQPLPPGAAPENGIDPDEAVAIALWRSPSLQAELTTLDAAMADLDEAGRLPNPRLSFLAPIDPRQLALVLAWPIEALWQVPLRARAASRELERVAESLVQIVLDLERDVRLAHADALLAHARVEVSQQISVAWTENAELAEARARAGDIAPAEAAGARAEVTIAADATVRAQHDAEIADARLLALMGAPWPEMQRLVASPAHATALPPRDELLGLALRQRPDVRAAELAIHAGAARARWERSKVFSLLATLDGQAPQGSLALDVSVGGEAVLPIFDQNRGGVGRAQADMARASYRYAATRLSVIAEVIAARAAVERAQSSLATYDAVLGALEEAVTAARHAYEHGAESYLVVADALRRATQARLQRIELDAELARAEAELARAVGGRAVLEGR